MKDRRQFRCGKDVEKVRRTSVIRHARRDRRLLSMGTQRVQEERRSEVQEHDRRPLCTRLNHISRCLS